MNATELIEKLLAELGGPAYPCEHRRGGRSCIQVIGEERRKRDGGLVLWYATDCRAAERLCPTCLAYWHVAVARNCLPRPVPDATSATEDVL